MAVRGTKMLPSDDKTNISHPLEVAPLILHLGPRRRRCAPNQSGRRGPGCALEAQGDLLLGRVGAALAWLAPRDFPS